MNSDKTPLVSIIVITYNSEKFILETLESAKTQTYQNIELIISDDASSDNTLQVCREWLKNNKCRFVHTELITVEKNSGIPANCNRGVKASKGEWIKLIAGDDGLLPNAIELMIEATNQYKDFSVFFANANFCKDNFEQKSIMKRDPDEFSLKYFSEKQLNPNQQLQVLIRHNPIIAATSFISRKVFEKVSFDERFKIIEDSPFWINASLNGYRLKFINKIVANYRIHSDSIQNHSSLFKKQVKTVHAYERIYLCNHLTKKERVVHRIYSFFYNVPFLLKFNKIRIICLLYNKLIFIPLGQFKSRVFMNNLTRLLK
jgi:alpha-1,3-rhamnosyltransferase